MNGSFMNFVKNVLILGLLVVIAVWAYDRYGIDDIIHKFNSNAPQSDTKEEMQDPRQNIDSEMPDASNPTTNTDSSDASMQEQNATTDAPYRMQFHYPETTTKLTIHPIGSFILSVESYPPCVKSVNFEQDNANGELLKGAKMYMKDNQIANIYVTLECIDTQYLEKTLEGLSPKDKEFMSKKASILKEMLVDQVIVLLTEGSSSKVIEKEYYSVKNLRRTSHVDKFFITSPDLSDEGDVIFTPGVVEPHRQ